MIVLKFNKRDMFTSMKVVPYKVIFVKAMAYISLRTNEEKALEILP